MTQPSLHQTFDTSLIDLKNDHDLDPDLRLTDSFSTTDTDTSDYEQRARATISAMEARERGDPMEDTPKAQHNAMFSPEANCADSSSRREISSPLASSSAPNSSRPTKYVSTEEAYNEWAAVYDTDGNMLQAIDDQELETMLPETLRLAIHNASDTLTILDVGCGTGRNTSKLIGYKWPSNTMISITGLELSAGMLEVAEKKLRPLESASPNVTLNLLQTDVFAPVSGTKSQNPPNADVLISTLVLEHVPLTPYFHALSNLLRPGGYALVTNMHQEMGLLSQAGFVATDGTKVRGTSWAHGTAESLKVAEEEGFEIVGSVKERRMEENMVGGVTGERGKKWIGIQVWYGMILRKKA
jgi:predicted TPR repeat methyltransferase